MGRRHRIVCLSSQHWDDAMWTNKQHIMSRLAKEHDVHYVNFGSHRSLRAILKQEVAHAPAELLAPRRLLLEPRVRVEHGVKLMSFYKPELFNRLRHGRRLRVFAEFDLEVSLLDRYLRREGLLDAIVWVYHPGFGANVKRLPHQLLVYDCVDEYTAFPEFKLAKPWIAARERELCRAADLVFCTAPVLHQNKQHLNPGHTHLVHNVGDADHFKRAMLDETVVPDDLARLPHPVIGFVGAVSDYKLNIDWLIHLAKARPSFQIAVIGPAGIADPTTDVSALQQLPNVHLLGHRSYDTLPSYLKGFDVATIPYRLNDYTEGVFPIKFFEFLASGKPVVVSALPATKDYWSAVRVAHDADEFVSACDAALEAGDAGRAERVALAEQNSWPKRIGELMRLVDERLTSRAEPRR